MSVQKTTYNKFSWGNEPNESTGKLTVIGAGPGDVELITLKAIKALKAADVVLYDALVATELLEYAEAAEQIFVGKRKGCYAYQQEQINDLIVERASQGRHVVRLKGGDPFVFGRGAEEMEFAASRGIEVAHGSRYILLFVGSCLAEHSGNKERCIRKFLGHHRYHKRA